VQDAVSGLKAGNEPQLTKEGTSGAYFIKGTKGLSAIFKPVDEEQYAPNNPR
jgi:hypothetical protein